LHFDEVVVPLPTQSKIIENLFCYSANQVSHAVIKGKKKIMTTEMQLYMVTFQMFP